MFVLVEFELYVRYFDVVRVYSLVTGMYRISLMLT